MSGTAAPEAPEPPRRRRTDIPGLAEHLVVAQKTDIVGRLATAVAHDLGNLLTVILGHCELLLADLEPANPIRDDLLVVQQTAEDAAGLIDQLLAAGRRKAFRPVEVDLGPLVESIGPILQRMAGSSVTVACPPAPHPLRVWIDPGQFEQVLLNLVANACDAMPNGGAVVIDTSPDPSGEGAVVTIADTGAGMDRATLDQACDPFFTTKAPGVATGMGLTVAHAIVTQAGGTLTLASTPGEGATVTIRLPFAAGPPA